MQHERNPRGRHFIALADLRRRNGDHGTAIGLLRAGLDRCPDSVSARWLLGQCLLARESFDDAAELIGQVLEQDPGHALAAKALERCCRGDVPEVAPEPEPAVEAAPEPEPVVEAAPEPEIAPQPVAVEAATTEDIPVVAEADAPGADAVPSMFVTRTLADIYLAQGHRDKALRILYQVLEAHPDREDIVTRIKDLEAAADAPAQSEDASPEDLNRSRFDAWVSEQDREG